MVATFIQSKAGTAATSGKVATAQYDSNLTANSLLVAICSRTSPGGDLPIPMITDDQGNAWKQAEEGVVVGALFGNNRDHGADVWYCETHGSGNRPVVTATLQGFPPLDPSIPVLGRMVVFLLEYGGFSNWEPWESSGVLSITGTSGTPTTRDSCSANDLLVSVVIHNGSAATVPAGWNSRVNDTTTKFAVADKLDSGGAAAQGAAWTGLTGNTKGYGIVVAFKPAGTRVTNDIRCVRFQYRLEELFSAPVTVPVGTAVSPAFVSPVVGNSLILYSAAYGGGDVVEMTDDHGNQWEQLYVMPYDPAGNGSGSMWICRRCVGTAPTITITATIVIGNGSYLANEAAWTLFEYINLPADTDVLTSGIRVSHTTTAPSIATEMATPAVPTLVLGFLAGGIDNFCGLDHVAGYKTRFGDSGAENQVIEKVTSVSAVQTAAWSYANNQVASYFVVALGSRSASSSAAVVQRRASFIAPSLPPHIGQRAESIEWQVLEPDLTIAGTLTPTSQEASVRHDVSSDIIRTADQLSLSESDCAHLNMLTTRLRPVWTMDDLSRWPLGAFMFAAADRHPRTMAGASTRTMSMYDGNMLLMDKRREPFGMMRGSSVRSAILQLLEEVQIYQYSIGATGAVVGDDLAWPGGTPRLTILRHLCALAGLLRPYFDNNGACIVRNSPDLDSAEADISYDTGPSSRICVESIVTAKDLFDVPNIYVVYNNGATESEVSGYALVPASMPHSVQNTGREKVEPIPMQGLTDSNAAFAVARAASMQRLGDYYTVEFEAAPDPRHDSYMIVGYNGDNFREVAWDLPCTRGARHRHSLRQAYSLVQNPGDTAPSGVGTIMP